MDSAKVAVALSVYSKDNEVFLQESIDSILNQSYQNFFLYIAVDGIVNSKIKLLLEQYNQNKQVRVLWFNANKGLACRLNDIINVAIDAEYNFKYLARMDADDIAYKTRFKEQIIYMESNSDISVLGTGLKEINNHGDFLFEKKAIADSKTLEKNIIKRCPVNHPTVLIRMDVFREGFRYKPELQNTQDYYLWVDLLAAGKRFANIEKPLLYFRIDDNFYSRRGFKKAKNDFKARIYAMQKLKIFSITNIIHTCALFLLRVSPASIKKLAYKYLR